MITLFGTFFARDQKNKDTAVRSRAYLRWLVAWSSKEKLMKNYIFCS